MIRLEKNNLIIENELEMTSNEFVTLIEYSIDQFDFDLQIEPTLMINGVGTKFAPVLSIKQGNQTQQYFIKSMKKNELLSLYYRMIYNKTSLDSDSTKNALIIWKRKVLIQFLLLSLFLLIGVASLIVSNQTMNSNQLFYRVSAFLVIGGYLYLFFHLGYTKMYYMDSFNNQISYKSLLTKKVLLNDHIDTITLSKFKFSYSNQPNISVRLKFKLKNQKLNQIEASNLTMKEVEHLIKVLKNVAQIEFSNS